MKISIHGSSLGILPIILPIILTTPSIHCSHGNLRTLIDDGEMVEQVNAEVEGAIVEKVPIDLNLSENPPFGISVIQGSWIPGHITYIVDGQHYNTHRIGDVSDGNYLLRDDERNIERVVYLYNEEDGMRALRVVDFLMTEDGIQKDIIEMMKRPGEPFYEPLRRLPVDIDLLEECPHQISILRDPDFGLVTYNIRSELANRAVIGVVRYGGHLVEDLPNMEVVRRNVTLYKDGGFPEVSVISYMKNGQKNTKISTFVEEEEGLQLAYEQRHIH